jgi:hypothetical protein
MAGLFCVFNQTPHREATQMKPKKDNAISAQRFRLFCIEGCVCLQCKNYRGRKRGCKFDECRIDDEKLDTMAAGRRKRGLDKWDS